jgi:hypothetical protein
VGKSVGVKDMKRKLPRHISGTIHSWRVTKRQEMNKLIKAAHRVLVGAAYTPTIEIEGKTISYLSLFQQLSQMKNAWSQKNWGK